MRASLGIMMLCTLGGGIVIGLKFNDFSGNRGIANSQASDSPRWISPVKEGSSIQLSNSKGVDGQRRRRSDALNSSESFSTETLKRATQLLDEMRDTDLERDLATALGTDSVGIQVARGLMAGRHQEVVGASEISNAFLNDLKSDPRAGLEVIREALLRIPSKGFEADRLTLLQTASSLSGMGADASQLALDEVHSNIVDLPFGAGESSGGPGDSGTRASLVVSAHRMFIHLSESSDAAFSGTVQGLVRQPDSAIRRKLIDQFLAKFPDRRDDLQSELVARQLDPYRVDVAGIVDEKAPVLGDDLPTEVPRYDLPEERSR